MTGELDRRVGRQARQPRRPPRPDAQRRPVGRARSVSLLSAEDGLDARRAAGNAAVSAALTARRDPVPDAQKPERGAAEAMQLGLRDVQLSRDDESALAEAFP